MRFFGLLLMLAAIIVATELQVSADSSQNTKTLEDQLKEANSHIQCLELELQRYKIDNTDCGKRNEPFTKIVGGNITEPNEYPWMITIVRTKTSDVWCGGSLLNARWVISAAHCNINPGDHQIILGNHLQNITDEHEIRREIKKAIVHPTYNHISKENDFSLLEMNQDLQLNSLRPFIQPVCLPRLTKSFNNVDVIATGWGKIYHGGPTSNELRAVDLTTITNEQCKVKYPSSSSRKGKIGPSTICANAPGRDTCQGDSGGPLVTEVCDRYYLIGVTSWGDGCADPEHPGVYARVTEALVWITSTISARDQEGGCQSPWFLLGNQCFLVVDDRSEKANWTSAREKCANLSPGADLAQPKDVQPYDIGALATYMVDNGYPDTWYYLGGSDIAAEGVWRWINDDASLTNSNNWRQGQPNGGDGEDCLAMYPAYGVQSLYDVSCETKLPFICEQGPPSRRT